MKKYILTTAWIICLLLPQSIWSQKDKVNEAIILQKLGLDIEKNLTQNKSQAKRLIFVWDSIYDIGRKQQLNNLLSDSTWIDLFLNEINIAKAAKKHPLEIKLKYFVAQLYHSQKLFSKSIPLQLSLLKESKFLSKSQLQKLYARLERGYIQTNDLKKALEIRKQRLALGLAEGSYDLYADFELYELALKDFLSNAKPIKDLKAVDVYKYYKIIGNYYFELGKLDSARKYFNEGLSISNYNISHPDGKTPVNIHENGKASLLGSIGRCYLAEGNYQKAIVYLLKDVENSEEDINNKIFKMIHLANAYIALGNKVQAKIYISEINQLTKGKEDKRMGLRTSEMKSNYFKLTNQLDSALFYANQYITLEDIHTEHIRKNQAILLLSNIETEARNKDLLITKTKLEKERADKKAQQIFLWASVIIIIMASISMVILMYSNIQKSKSKKVIEKKNEENELLLKELHHRVKNNLQVIYSLINLQKRRIEGPELNQSLSMVQNRIKTMSLVHQNLHEHDNLKDVNLNAYIKTIADYLGTLYLTDEKKIDVIVEVDESIELIMDKSITIGLLINEIMSNSLKYAFKSSKTGQINICIQKHQNGYQMKISDNGTGFNEEEIKKKSLGMYLIENLVKQIQGKYELENIDGTTYTIYFKA